MSAETKPNYIMLDYGPVHAVGELYQYKKPNFLPLMPEFVNLTTFSESVNVYNKIAEYAKAQGKDEMISPYVHRVCEKYYLTETQMDYVYYHIILKCIENEIKEKHNSFSSTLNEKRDILRFPTANISAMQQFMHNKILQGERSISALCEDALCEAFKKESLFLSGAIAETIQALVVNAMIVGALNKNNEFEMPFVALGYHLGSGFFTSYLYESKDFHGLFGYVKNQINIDVLEQKYDLWKDCYEYVKFNAKSFHHMDTVFLDKECQWHLRMILKKHQTYSESLISPILLKLVILKIINLGLLHGSKEGIQNAFTRHLKEVGVESRGALDERLFITECINNILTVSGVVLLEFLCEQKIFMAYLERNPNTKELTRMAQLKSSISLSLQLSTSYFYPYLTESNKELYATVSFEHNSVHYKVPNLEHEIHNDAANTGTLNKNCIFHTNSKALLTRYSIDIYFLMDSLSKLDEFANICIQDVSDERKEIIYKLLSMLYSINFKKIHKDYLSTELINYALNFNLLSNVILLKKIKELEDKSTY
jgi:hypothetical protein